MKKYLSTGIALTILCMTAFGQQQQQKVVADKIVAQIGNGIILKSDIDGRINDAKRAKLSGDPNAEDLPPNADCMILRTQIMLKALAIQAQLDSLPVSDEDYEMAFQNRLGQMIAQFGGDKQRMEQAFGKTVSQIHQELMPSIKEQYLAQKEQQHITENTTVTPAEVLAYYNSIPKDSLSFYESEFEANQIVMYPTPNKDVVEFIKGQLETWKKEVETGKANFQDLAKVYSDDPSAKQNGGLISMNKEDDKGRFDPDFFNAAFRLRDGQISPVVKSQFGYHIIQMVSRVGNNVTVRHILKIPPITDEEIKSTVSKMDSIRTLLVDKKLDFATAFNLVNEDKTAQFNAGAIMGNNPYPVTPFTIDELSDKDLASLLATLKVGDYSKPQVFSDPQTNRKSVRIIYLKSRTEPHRENMRDDYDKIQNRALAIKKQEILDQWLKEHIGNFYIQVDPGYAHCSELEQWTKQSSERVEHFSANSIR